MSDDSPDGEPPRRTGVNVGVGVAIGAGVGTGIFAATDDPVWIAIGPGAGAIITSVIAMLTRD